MALDRKVAVKVIKAEWAATNVSAKKHALALAKNQHQNIVTVFDVATVQLPDTGEPVEAVIMEWLEGEALGERLKRGGLSHDEVVEIFRGLLRALKHLHSNDLTHGDLHAGNVMLCNGVVKVIDMCVDGANSQAHFSSMSSELRKRDDIAGVGRMMRFCINQSSEAYPQFVEGFSELSTASSIEDLERFLSRLVETNVLSGTGTQEVAAKSQLDKLELNTEDQAILRIMGEQLASADDQFDMVSFAFVRQEATKLGISETAVEEAIDVLSTKSFFRDEQIICRDFAQLSEYGFSQFLNYLRPEFQSELSSVIEAIVSKNLYAEHDIVNDTGIAGAIVQHILKALEARNYIEVAWSIGGSLVITVSPMLKRKVKP